MCSRTRSGPSSYLKGLVREERRMVPPRGRIPRVDSIGLLVGVLERAAPAVPEADDRVPVTVDPAADDRPDDRVETGAISAPREHPDPHPMRKSITPSQNLRLGPEAHTAALPAPVRRLSRRREQRASPREGELRDGLREHPAHGVAAPAGKAVEAGARLALEDAGRRAGALKIRMRTVSSTEPGGRSGSRTW